MWEIIILFILVGFVFFVALLIRILRKKMNLWLPAYLRQRTLDVIIHKKRLPQRHLILCICDHFDLGSGGKYFEGEEKIIDEWEKKFPKFSDRHRDSQGVCLKHTWFYPYHYHRSNYLERMVGICSRGHGEIEMHLHHDHHPPWPDTSETLRKKIQDCISEYARYGVFCLPNGKRTFGFIHGDWALDNSRNGRFCGVNDEIKILGEEGCYADFTFPSPFHESQPQKINSIYYVIDDPEKPKSYNEGFDVHVGGKKIGDLMIIQGPLGVKFKKKFNLIPFPCVEASEVEHNNIPELSRVKTWLKCNVTVKGKLDWIFVKLHTHGAFQCNFEHNFGLIGDKFFSELEEQYCCNGDICLHYVTAREMYNIIKAAEAGLTGNPTIHRNFLIPSYVYI